jgi:hypothetical protein
MNETRTRRGPDPRLLLLIPAVMIIAKAGRRRREMMAERWSGSGAGGRPHGHHRFGGPDGELGPRAFRLPPRIESALDAWHTRAHEASETTEPHADPGTATA